MIRDLGIFDVTRLKELHGLGKWQYELPNPMGSEILARRGYETDINGKPTIVQAILARRTVELYMLSDPIWETPKWRLEVLKKLHSDVEQQLAAQGVEDVFVWVPPQVDNFRKRLEGTFGWAPVPWFCMTTFVKKAG